MIRYKSVSLLSILFVAFCLFTNSIYGKTKKTKTNYLSAGLSLSGTINYNGLSSEHVVGGEISYFTTDTPYSWFSFYGLYFDYQFLNNSRNFRLSLGPELGYAFEKTIFLIGFDAGFLIEKQSDKSLTGINLRSFFAIYNVMIYYRHMSLNKWQAAELGLLFKVPIPIN